LYCTTEGEVSTDMKCPVLFAINGTCQLAIAFLAVRFLSSQQSHRLHRKINNRRANGKVTGIEKVRRILQFWAMIFQYLVD